MDCSPGVVVESRRIKWTGHGICTDYTNRMRLMGLVACTGEIYTIHLCWSEILKRRNHLVDVGIEGRIVSLK